MVVIIIRPKEDKLIYLPDPDFILGSQAFYNKGSFMSAEI